MAFGGGLGFAVDLAATGLASAGTALAAEGGSRFVVEVPERRVPKFLGILRGLPCARLGHVTSEGAHLEWSGATLEEFPLAPLYPRWREGLGLPG
jgi:hypothetical protein